MNAASERKCKDGKSELFLLDQISDLERKLTASKLHLNAETERCENLQQQAATFALEKLCLEKNLTELECQYSETKKELDKISKENLNLISTKCDLEIAVAEDDVYDQVLKENINELENLCTTLREQRDEQNNYHKQKETCLKNEHEQQLAKIKADKCELIKNLTDLNMENISLRDELEHLRNAQHDWKKEKQSLHSDHESVAMRAQRLEKDLKMEKETVNMLTIKNNDLATSLMVSDAKRPSSAPISKDTISMIEELVGKFYEKKIQATSNFNDKVIADLKKQLSDCQSALAEEKRIRDRLELQLETSEINLSKAKSSAESLFELSVARTRNNLNRCNNLKLSPRLTEFVSPRTIPLATTQLLNLSSHVDVVPLSADKLSGHHSTEHRNIEENASSAAESIFTNVSSSSNSVAD